MSIVSVLCICTVLPARAQEPAAAGDEARRPVPSEKEANNPTPKSHQTAEDLLRALQSTKPVNEVILPASRAGKGPIIDRRTLLPEGATIVERRGKLVRQTDGWAFQAQEGQMLRALPNGQLELMLAMQSDVAGMEFVVSGEITLFGDQNYLLIKHVERGSAAPSREPAPVAAAGVPSDASAEDVLSALSSQRPDAGATSRGGAAVVDRPGGVTVGGFIDGALVVRRPGRLLREGGRWHFKFDDSQAANVSMLEVLPNQSLEIMVNADRGTGTTAYVVSGETTQFQNGNFLLIRGVTRLQDTGNLRPWPGPRWERGSILQINLDRTRSFPVARLAGSLAGLDVDQLADALGETPYGEEARLAFDLSELRSIDSSGLAALIAIVTRSRMSRGRVVLVSPSAFVAGVLSVTRLDGWFDVCGDLAAAEQLLK